MKMIQISSEERHPNEKMAEDEFGYHTRSEVYAKESSDIKKLGEIVSKRLKISDIYTELRCPIKMEAKYEWK